MTNRELEVMNLIAEGLSNKEIAESLHMTVNTVKSHKKYIWEAPGESKSSSSGKG